MQKMPARLLFVDPMECKEVRRLESVPSSKEWQYEVKFDGYRCIAIKQHNEIELHSRRGNVFKQFLNLFDPLLEQRAKSFIVDGEIVALDESGKSAFNRLQRAASRRAEVHFYIFDLLNLDGEKLFDQPLSKRQQLLWRTFRESDFIHLPRPLDTELDLIVQKIQEFGFEGVIAKRKDSIYVPGAAPGSWVKKKLKQSEEFIIGGYEPGKNKLEGIAVGRYAGKEFNYVALVDDGFVPNTRRQVFEAIKNLRTAVCPFVNVPEKKGMHRLDRERMAKMIWVKPKEVVEIAMNEWTPDRHLRHSEFKRLRPEKSLKDVAAYPT